MLLKITKRLTSKSPEAKFWSEVSQSKFTNEINFEDYQKITIKSLNTKALGSLKLLTFPHLSAFNDTSTYQDLSALMHKKLVLFEYDPTKLIQLTRQVYHNEYESQFNQKSSHANPNHIISLIKLTEPILTSEILSSLVFQNNQENLPIEVLSKQIKEYFLMRDDSLFTNPNVYNFFLYLMLNGQADFTIGFGGILESVFRAKISQQTTKSKLFESFLSFLKFMLQNLELNKIDSQAQTFGPNEIIEMRLRTNTQMLKARYIKVYAEELIRTTGQDVVIVSDPFMKNQFENMEFLDKFNENSQKDKTDQVKYKKIQDDYKNMTKRIFDDPDFGESLKKANENYAKNNQENEKVIDYERDPTQEFHKMTFKDLSTIDEINIKNEASDLIFKMALWDIVHETNFYESSFISNKYYYLRKDLSKISKENIAEFDKQFHLSFQILKKIKSDLMSQIKMCERPISAHDALEEIKKATGLEFDWIPEKNDY